MADLNDKVAAIRAGVLGTYQERCDAMAALLESPIERAVYWALLDYGTEWGQPRVEVVEDYGSWFSIPTEMEQIAVSPQYRVDAGGRQYRLDFMAEADVGEYPPSTSACRVHVKAAVECDGHDFHERTKEQAARDRKRDRDLQAAGYLILRFTGSEINKDPAAVAREIVGAINAKSREAFDAWFDANAPKGKG
jgi:hypothetical protein